MDPKAWTVVDAICHVTTSEKCPQTFKDGYRRPSAQFTAKDSSHRLAVYATCYGPGSLRQNMCQHGGWGEQECLVVLDKNEIVRLGVTYVSVAGYCLTYKELPVLKLTQEVWDLSIWHASKLGRHRNDGRLVYVDSTRSKNPDGRFHLKQNYSGEFAKQVMHGRELIVEQLAGGTGRDVVGHRARIARRVLQSEFRGPGITCYRCTGDLPAGATRCW